MVTQPNRLQLHSPPDTARPAKEALRVDFEDKIRLLGVDPPRQTMKAGTALTMVAYLRALQDLEDEDYTIFLHLDDAVTGETVATVDKAHPGDIPTSDWATGLYVRSPLKLTVPAHADPIQYVLRLGFYDARSGDLLSLADGGADLYDAARVWVTSPVQPRPPDGPRARFGESIELLGAELDADAGEVIFYWRTREPVAQNYSVFVHLLDENGETIGQLDGAPYANRYPTGAWRPGQIIEDRRALAAAGADVSRIHRIVLGLYDPASGERLPAYDDRGDPLPDHALVLPIEALE